ncbi:phenoloxidase-activating enzyme 1 isoform X2 [Aethina tumida]|nr:phenoloxidase-activating enzyme 1 isoform X2 [Aethina tumida]
MAMTLVRTKKYAPETIEFLKTSHCGIRGSEPMVFCPTFRGCSNKYVQNGTCAHVHNCKPIQRAIREIDEHDVWTYLEGRRCYTDDYEFRVCCPQEDVQDRIFDDDNFIFDNPPPSRTLEPPKETPSSPPSPPTTSSPPRRNTPRTDNSILNLSSGQCGVHISENNRITGGSSTELGEFPWMAILVYVSKSGMKNGCGGSLINSKYIVTAGHCLDKEVLRQFQLQRLDHVILGEYDTNNETDCIFGGCSDPPIQYFIESFKVHPKFKIRNPQNDIGLIRLSTSVTFSDYIKPICLPNRDFTLQGNETFDIAGWGQTLTALSSSVKLKARIKYASPEECKQLNKKLVWNKSQVCAGGTNGKDTCKGDSGGPLMLGQIYGSEYIYLLVGITSFGLGPCGTRPSVYTYLPPYVDWIQQNIK